MIYALNPTFNIENAGFRAYFYRITLVNPKAVAKYGRYPGTAGRAHMRPCKNAQRSVTFHY
jgi:hypothetical protein